MIGLHELGQGEGRRVIVADPHRVFERVTRDVPLHAVRRVDPGAMACIARPGPPQLLPIGVPTTGSPSIVASFSTI